MESWNPPRLPQLQFDPQPLSMYDTASQGVTELKPQHATASSYVCGITPYDSTHLGHAATYVTFDLLHRQLISNGYELNYVQNVTNVDTPLFDRARRDGGDWKQLGDEQTALFRNDLEQLGVIPPQNYVTSIDAMDDIIALVQQLLEQGDAYILDDPEYPDVYAKVSATDHFGYESHLDREEMLRLFASRGGDPEREGKQDPLDALIWRCNRPDEPKWDAPFGAGRPGWHIQCAATIKKYLPTPCDVQAGGGDLVFPHHEYTAAHVESATDCDRMAGHYMHTGLIGLAGVKMSKSLGNLVFVRHLTGAGTDPSAIRLALFADHYRTPRNWSNELLATATRRLALWRTAIEQGELTGDEAQQLISELRNALAHDLDTPTALAIVDRWALQAIDPTALWQRPGADGASALDVNAAITSPGFTGSRVSTLTDDGVDEQADKDSVAAAHHTAGTKYTTEQPARGQLLANDVPPVDPNKVAFDAAKNLAAAIELLMGVRLLATS